jgi:AAA domain, putative AbiEii toxin, Type IV TA system/AAA domain
VPVAQADIGFRSLFIYGWRQFDQLAIDFHPRLTILTGANASGKSTVLSLLRGHFNWMRNYSTAPRRDPDDPTWSAFGDRPEDSYQHAPGSWDEVGRLMYADGAETLINVYEPDPAARQQYDVQFPSQRPVAGVFLTSHRFITGNYVPVPTIPALFGTSDQLFEQFTNELRTRWQGSWTGRTPQLAFKESLIAAAVWGEGNSSVDPNPEAAAIWEGFQRILRDILPQSLRFERLRIRVPDIIVETETGDFILDEASAGMSAILEMAWQVFLRARNVPQFTVLLDEPENHLHPRLQRELLPSMLQAFPSVQFIVATHSPFVVTATPDSAVYVLDYNDNQRVESRRLDYANKAGSADDTLQRVLGLPSTMPISAEERFQRIIDQHLTGAITAEGLAELRDALRRDGLESQFTEAMLAVTNRAEQNP